MNKPLMVLVDGNNVLAFKCGSKRSDYRPGDPSAVVEERLWIEGWLNAEPPRDKRPVSSPRAWRYPFQPKVHLLLNLLTRLDELGTEFRLFRDTSFNTWIASANRNDPKAGYRAAWDEIDRQWGRNGKNWILPPPQGSSGKKPALGDTSSTGEDEPNGLANNRQAQADHALLATALSYFKDRRLRVVTNDEFRKDGEREQEAFKPLFVDEGFLVNMIQLGPDRVLFGFCNPEDQLVVPAWRDVTPVRVEPKSVSGASHPTSNRDAAHTPLVTGPGEHVFDGLSFRCAGHGVSAAKHPAKDVIRFGTSEQQCDFVVDGKVYGGVSRSHLELRKQAGTWWVLDTSTNGTYLDDVKLPPLTPVQLPDRGALALVLPENEPDTARLVIRFRCDTAASVNRKSPHESSEAQAREAEALPVLSLEFSNGQREQVTVGLLPFRLGRSTTEQGLAPDAYHLSEDMAWGLSSKHLKLVALGTDRQSVQAENLAAKSNGTGLIQGSSHVTLAAGAFEWPIAQTAFDRSQPHLKLIDREGFARSRNLQPVLAWLTRPRAAR